MVTHSAGQNQQIERKSLMKWEDFGRTSRNERKITKVLDKGLLIYVGTHFAREENLLDN
ncbi:MAG: hypothetical protein WA826_21645 [Silvibacterium sp.]